MTQKNREGDIWLVSDSNTPFIVWFASSVSRKDIQEAKEKKTPSLPMLGFRAMNRRWNADPRYRGGR